MISQSTMHSIKQVIKVSAPNDCNVNLLGRSALQIKTTDGDVSQFELTVDGMRKAIKQYHSQNLRSMLAGIQLMLVSEDA